MERKLHHIWVAKEFAILFQQHQQKKNTPKPVYWSILGINLAHFSFLLQISSGIHIPDNSSYHASGCS